MGEGGACIESAACRSMGWEYALNVNMRDVGRCDPHVLQGVPVHASEPGMLLDLQ